MKIPIASSRTSHHSKPRRCEYTKYWANSTMQPIVKISAAASNSSRRLVAKRLNIKKLDPKAKKCTTRWVVLTAFLDCVRRVSLARNLTFAEPGSNDPMITTDIHKRANQRALRRGIEIPKTKIGSNPGGSVRSNSDIHPTIHDA